MTEQGTDPCDRGYAKLSRQDCERLHAASLEILERTGVRLHEPEALRLVQEAGAKVTDDNRVRIPHNLVEKALETTPHNIELYNQIGEPAASFSGRNSFFGNGCDCLYVIDHRTGERRMAVLQDIVEAITLCDALENVDYVMSTFLPSDVNGAIADRYQMEAMLNHTTKPICFVTHSYQGWQDAIEMAEIVAGGSKPLREKPFVVPYINATTALRHNEDSLQKLLYSAGKGLPTIYIGGVAPGLTTPITVAGALALCNAGCLVGLVLSQLKRPGTPMIIAGGLGGGLDMRTMVLPYGEPQPMGGLESMAHYYDLPMFSTAGASNGKLVDQQASIEAALTLMVDALSGGHMVHNLGYLESAMAGSLVQLAVGNEILSWIKDYTKKIEINDETLALDLIDEIGPDGEFLNTSHTARHFRERWYPQLIERGNFEQWQERGALSIEQRAAAQVQQILDTHQPQMLPAEIARVVHGVVARAEEMC